MAYDLNCDISDGAAQSKPSLLIFVPSNGSVGAKHEANSVATL